MENMNIISTPDGRSFHLKNTVLLDYGAFGVVYAAKFSHSTSVSKSIEALWHDCAAKYFRSQMPNEEGELSKLNRLLGLGHKNIVSIYDYGAVQLSGNNLDNQFKWCIIMELCSTKTLRRKVEHEPLSPQTVEGYTSQILCGLNHLHENGIIHTDIKAANILLTNDDSVIKIGDLDASIVLKDVQTITDDVTNCQGTWRWMSPEMVLQRYRGDQQQQSHIIAGRKTDIWSFGCVLLEMTTRKSPEIISSDGCEIMTDVNLVLVAKKGFWPVIPPNVDADVKSLLAKCFQTNPISRPWCSELLHSDGFGNSRDASTAFHGPQIMKAADKAATPYTRNEKIKSSLMQHSITERDLLTSKKLAVSPNYVSKLLESAEIMVQGNPSTYKLKRTLSYEDGELEIHKFIMGDRMEIGNITEKVVLFVGAAGVGKSTLIDALLNYVCKVQWNDSYRLKTVVPGKCDSELQFEITSTDVNTYTFYPENDYDTTVRWALTMIDTPGFSDTPGLAAGKQIEDQLRELFCPANIGGLNTLTAVGFVVPNSSARLTTAQSYIFDSILSVLGKDLAENIFLMITFADGTTLPVLKLMEKANIPLHSHFQFNNSVMFEQKSETSVFSELHWQAGSENTQNFLKTLHAVSPKTLSLTRVVLRAREELDGLLESLHQNITSGVIGRAVLAVTPKLLPQAGQPGSQNHGTVEGQFCCTAGSDDQMRMMTLQAAALEWPIKWPSKKPLPGQIGYLFGMDNSRSHHPDNEATMSGISAPRGDFSTLTSAYAASASLVNPHVIEQRLEQGSSSMSHVPAASQQRQLNRFSMSTVKSSTTTNPNNPAGGDMTVRSLGGSLPITTQCDQRYQTNRPTLLPPRSLRKSTEVMVDHRKQETVRLIKKIKKIMHILNNFALRPDCTISAQYINELLEAERVNQTDGWEERVQQLQKIKRITNLQEFIRKLDVCNVSADVFDVLVNMMRDLI